MMRAYALALALAACANLPPAPPPQVGGVIEAISFSGRPLTRPPLAPEFQAGQERLLAEAQAALARDPDDAEAAIWAGRRLGYLGRYNEAIAAFQAGAARHPQDARFLRHLGHRYITVRRLDDAIDALERAAALMASRPDEVEPDGLPNAANVPTSTLKGNIYYHLGLAYYLSADFRSAADNFRIADTLAANPDSTVAARYWLYLSLARGGNISGAQEMLAPIRADWQVLESTAYHQLTLCFRGDIDCAALRAQARRERGLQSTTLAYGLAAHARLQGRRAEATALLREIVAQPDWASFGYIAAEADLAN